MKNNIAIKVALISMFTLAVWVVTLLAGIAVADRTQTQERAVLDLSAQDDAAPEALPRATQAVEATVPQSLPLALGELEALGRYSLYLTPTEKPATQPSQKGDAQLGVHVRPTDPTLQKQLQLRAGSGLVVEHVSGAAEEAGLQVHDILVKLDDQLLVNRDQLSTLISMRKPGDLVQITIMRAGEEQTVSAKLLEAPDDTNVELWLSPHGNQQFWLDLTKAHDITSPQFQDCKACHQVSSQNYLDRIPYLNHLYKEEAEFKQQQAREK